MSTLHTDGPTLSVPTGERDRPGGPLPWRRPKDEGGSSVLKNLRELVKTVYGGTFNPLFTGLWVNTYFSTIGLNSSEGRKIANHHQMAWTDSVATVVLAHFTVPTTSLDKTNFFEIVSVRVDIVTCKLVTFRVILSPVRWSGPRTAPSRDFVSVTGPENSIGRH